MCGIFGGIGWKLDPGALRFLAYLNYERGTDSTGFHDYEGRIYKTTEDARAALRGEAMPKFIDSCVRSGLCVGHTRASTRGAVTRDNAHPFQYGNVIGTHNGVVSAPLKYDVDSMYLVDSLAQYEDDFGDADPPGWFDAALKRIDGYWGLTVWNHKHLYLTNWSHQLYFLYLKDKRALYWSSDWKHLDQVFGERDSFSVEEGDILRVKYDRRRRQLTFDTYESAYTGGDYSSMSHWRSRTAGGDRYDGYDRTGEEWYDDDYSYDATRGTGSNWNKWYTTAEGATIHTTKSESGGMSTFLTIEGEDVRVHWSSADGMFLPGPKPDTLDYKFYQGMYFSGVKHCWCANESCAPFKPRYDAAAKTWVWDEYPDWEDHILDNRLNRQHGTTAFSASDESIRSDGDREYVKRDGIWVPLAQPRSKVVRRKWDKETQRLLPLTEEEEEQYRLADEEEELMTSPVKSLQ